VNEWKTCWPNFRPEEFLSPVGLIYFNHKGDLLVQRCLLDGVQALRDYYKKPTFVNMPWLDKPLRYRGYRDYDENKAAKGSSHSYHMQGIAADVTVEGIDPMEVAEYAMGLDGERSSGSNEVRWGGIIVYDSTL